MFSTFIAGMVENKCFVCSNFSVNADNTSCLYHPKILFQKDCSVPNMCSIGNRMLLLCNVQKWWYCSQGSFECHISVIASSYCKTTTTTIYSHAKFLSSSCCGHNIENLSRLVGLQCTAQLPAPFCIWRNKCSWCLLIIWLCRIWITVEWILECVCLHMCVGNTQPWLQFSSCISTSFCFR